MKTLLFSVYSRFVILLFLCSINPSLVAAEYGEPTLVTHQGFYHKQGPNKAKGVIIWSPGTNSEEVTHPKAKGGGMPYFLDWIYGNGWDVYYIERTGGLKFTDRPRHAEAIRNAVAGLSGAGYKKVVLGGQSSGGIYSMIAANEPLSLHGLILTASGPNLGSFTFEQALSEAQADRYIVIHLANDKVIGQRSQETVQSILDYKTKPNLNIFEPSGIEGHDGAYTSSFSKQFADQMLMFLEADY
jgi:pimeloyl-ACP methyl ester carboxylesterase